MPSSTVLTVMPGYMDLVWAVHTKCPSRGHAQPCFPGRRCLQGKLRGLRKGGCGPPASHRLDRGSARRTVGAAPGWHRLGPQGQGSSSSVRSEREAVSALSPPSGTSCPRSALAPASVTLLTPDSVPWPSLYLWTRRLAALCYPKFCQPPDLPFSPACLPASAGQPLTASTISILLLETPRDSL